MGGSTLRSLVNRSILGAIVAAGGLLGWSLTATAQPPSPAEIKPDRPSRRVYVPLEELDVVFDRSAQGVILPRAQYDELQAAATKAHGSRPPGSAEPLLTQGEYRGKIEEDQLLLSARWEFTQFDAEWHALRLPLRSVAVESAKLDGKPAQLGRDTIGGVHIVLFSHEPGKHVLELELSSPLMSVGADKLVALGLPPIPAATLTLPVPAGKSLQLNLANPERPAPLDKPAEYRLAIGGQRSVSLRITDKQAAHSSESLIFASNRIGVQASAEELTWLGISSLQIFGQGIDSLEYLVPKSLEIVAVESPGLERWEIAAGPDAQSTALKLTYRQAVEEGRIVTFRGVVATSLGQPWSVPTLRLKQATSQVSQIAVQHAPGLRLQSIEQTGVRRVASRIGPSAGSVERWTFSAWKPDFALLFVTQPKARELQTTISTLLDINSRALALSSLITVQSRFAPLFELELTLPAEWTISDVKSADPKSPGAKKSIPWRIVPVEAGKHQVRIAFDPPLPAEGKVQLTLQAEMTPSENWPIETTPLVLKLPEVFLPQAAVTDGTFLIAVEDDLEALPEEVTGLDPAKSAAVAAGSVGPRLTYQYQDTHFGGRLKVSRKPQRIAARNVGFHRLDRETQVSHLESLLAIEGGGVRKLQVALPEATGTDLQFEVLRGAAEIVEQTAAAPAKGERVWTLQLDQQVRGVLVLGVDLSTPRAAETKSYPLPTLRILGADRQDSYVALEGGPDQQLTATAVDATGGPLAETPPDAIPAPQSYQPKERIVAAWHAILPGYKVSATETRFDRLGVPSALCDKQFIVTVLGSGGQSQHQATFQLRVSGVQSLLASLPDGALLWSTLIDGNPIEVRRADAGGTKYEIPLPREGAPGTPRQLQLLYQTEGTISGATGSLQQQPPTLELRTGQGTAQPLEILSRQWQVFHGRGLEIVESRGDFEPVGELSRRSLLGNVQFLWDKTAEMWITKIGIVAVVFVALWALMVAFRRRRWVGLLSVFVVLVGCMGLFLLLPAVQQSREMARKSQVRNNLKQTGMALQGHQHGTDGSTTVVTTESESREDLAATLQPPTAVRSLEAGRGEKPSESKPYTVRDRTKVRAPAAPRTQSSGEETGILPDHAVAKSEPKAESPVEDSPTSAPASRDLTLRNDYPKYGTAFGVLPNGQPNPNVPQAAAAPAAANAPADAKAPPAEEAAGQQGGEGPQARRRPTRIVRGAFAGEIGRLSLSLAVSPARGDVFSEFTFNGHSTSAEPQLDLQYLQRDSASLWTCALQFGLLWLGFWLRKLRPGRKAALAVLGWSLPIALTPLVPAAALPLLDGLFLGTTATVVLWCVLGAACWCASRCCPRVAARAVAPLALLVLGLSSTSLFAQEAFTLKPLQPASGRPTVIIPYDPARDMQQAERVFLPLEKFRALWNDSHPDSRLDRTTPVDGVVSEALYSAKFVPAEGAKPARVEVTARFAAHNFRNTQVTLPLPLRPVPLESVELDGKPAPLLTMDNNSDAINSKRPAAQVVNQSPRSEPGLAIVLVNPGLHVIDLKFTLAAEQTGPVGRFTLPLLPVSSGLLRFPLPAAGSTLQVNSRSVFRQVQQDQQKVALIPVDAGGNLTVSWAPPQTQGGTDGIVHTEGTTSLRFDDTGLRIQSTFDYVVRQGSLSSLQFSLPQGLLVRQIVSLDLAGWEMAGSGAQRTLKVFLRRPVTDRTRVQFDLYLSQRFTEETQQISLPDFGPRGVTRETGVIGVFAENYLTLSAGTIKGLSQIEPKQFAPPPAIRVSRSLPTGNPTAPGILPVLAYRYAARPIELPLLVARKKPQSQGEASHLVQVSPRKVRLWSLLNCNLAGAPRSEITALLPPGYLLYDLRGPGIADYFVEARGDAKNQPGILHVMLAGPRTGRFNLLLEGIVPRNPEEAGLNLSVPTLLNMSELRSTTGLWLDSLFSGNLQQLNDWKSIDPQQLQATLFRRLQTAAQFAFSSTSPNPQPISLTLARATPRLRGAAVTVAFVRETSLSYLLQLQWGIDLAGETQFTFTTPESLADRLDFSGNSAALRVRQVTSEKIAGGRLRWTVTLEEAQLQSLFLTARATLPPPTDGKIVAPRIGFEQRGAQPGQFLPLERQQEFLLLVNASPAPLDPLNAAGVQTVTAGDLPIRMGVQLTDQATEILKVAAGAAEVGWQVRARQQVQSLPATVNLANLRLLLQRDGSWRCQADYRINNRTRQFLAVELPAESRVLSLFVAGRPARPVQRPAAKGNVVLIPLPKTAAGDLSAEVRLVVAGRLAAGFTHRMQLLRRDIDLPAPRVLPPSEDAEFGMPVAATEWTVFLPKGMDVKPLDDPDRTNVAQTAEGYGQALAEMGEIMQLIDSSESMLKSSFSLPSSDYGARVDNRARTNSKVLFDKVSNLRSSLSGKLSQEQMQVIDQQYRVVEENQRKLSVVAPQAQTPAKKPANSLDALQEEQIGSNTIQIPAATAQKELEDEGLIGKLLDEADKMGDQYETFDINSEFEMNKPGPMVNGPGPGKMTFSDSDESGWQMLHDAEALTLNGNVIDYPSDWKRKSGGQGGKGNAQSQGKDGLNNRAAMKGDNMKQAEELAGQYRSGRQSQRTRGRDTQERLKGSQMFERLPGSPPAGGGGGGRNMAQEGQPRNENGQFVDGVIDLDIALGGLGDGDRQAAADDEQGTTPVAPKAGLSLPLDLPEEGEKFTFFKAGGDARLAVGVRPGETWQIGSGVLWAGIWLLIGGAFAIALTRHAQAGAFASLLSKAGIALGLVWFFLLPAGWLGFLLFVVSAIVFSWQRRAAVA